MLDLLNLVRLLLCEKSEQAERIPDSLEEMSDSSEVALSLKQ